MLPFFAIEQPSDFTEPQHSSPIGEHSTLSPPQDPFLTESLSSTVVFRIDDELVFLAAAIVVRVCAGPSRFTTRFKAARYKRFANATHFLEGGCELFTGTAGMGATSSSLALASL